MPFAFEGWAQKLVKLLLSLLFLCFLPRVQYPFSEAGRLKNTEFLR
jgi:hypothetical protein